MNIPLGNEASLVACKRVLAKIYNEHSHMTLSLRIEILEALGYSNQPEMVGALFQKQARLTSEGAIVYDTVVAEYKRK